MQDNYTVSVFRSGEINAEALVDRWAELITCAEGVIGGVEGMRDTADECRSYISDGRRGEVRKG